MLKGYTIEIILRDVAKVADRREGGKEKKVNDNIQKGQREQIIANVVIIILIITVRYQIYLYFYGKSVTERQGKERVVFHLLIHCTVAGKCRLRSEQSQEPGAPSSTGW